MNRHQRPHANPDARTQRGASVVEYVLMLSLILLVALAGVSAFGSTVGDNIGDSASRIVTAQGGG